MLVISEKLTHRGRSRVSCPVSWDVLSTARGTIYADEMPGNTPDGRHRCVDTVGLALHVSVLGAHDDPLVSGIATMEPNEVAAVQRQDGPAMGPGESQDVFIGHTLSCIACIPRCQDVVTKRAEPLDHGSGKVLVRIEPHASSFSWISRWISSGWESTYAHAAARSTARSDGNTSRIPASVSPCRR